MNLTPKLEAACIALADPARSRLTPAVPIVPADEGADEKSFQADVVKLAKRCGWRVFHVHDSRKSEKGWPDLVLLRGQVLLFVELKTMTGTVQPEQQEWLDALQTAGQTVHVLRPSDWPTIVEVLR